jgi:hypothetical protein
MRDAEAKLAAFWRADRPSVPDAMFRIGVLEQRARRRFHISVAWIAVAGLFAAAVIVMLVPALPVWTPSHTVLAALPFLSVITASILLFFSWPSLRVLR